MQRDSVIEIAQRISKLYREADRRSKGELLDGFIAATGYHRKAAIRLLLQLDQASPRLPRGRPRLYDDNVAGALRTMWEACDCLCSSRLQPFIPELVRLLRGHGELDVSDEVELRLCHLSRSTIDRMLRPFRQKSCSPFSTTRPGTLLSHPTPAEDPFESGASHLGVLSVDAIPHSGNISAPYYLTTVTAQDRATGWSECAVVWSDQDQLSKAIEQIHLRLPFSVHQIETSGVDEALCENLYGYCRGQGIVFMARDNAVSDGKTLTSEKNWTVVRRLVGFHRYGSLEEQEKLKETYGLAKLYMNFFQPHRKLVSRRIQDGKLHKVYDEALTPYQRLLEAGELARERERELRTVFEGLNPLSLRTQIYVAVNELRPPTRVQLEPR